MVEMFFCFLTICKMCLLQLYFDFKSFLAKSIVVISSEIDHYFKIQFNYKCFGLALNVFTYKLVQTKTI